LEEAISSVEEELSAADKKTIRAMFSLNSLVDERLKADDQVLEALSKLAARAIPQSSNTVDPNTVDQWTRALVSLRETATKTRFETALQRYVYEAANAEDMSNDATSNSTPGKDEQEAQLEALREEILSVVELAVASEFRTPLLQTLKASQVHARNSQHDWLEYVMLFEISLSILY
jgi:hypothetical protein